MFKFQRLFNTKANYNLTKISFKSIADKRHHTNFDIKVDWLAKFVISKHISLSRILALVNLGLFLYVNFRINREKSWIALSGVSYSFKNFKDKDYTTLFVSQLGSYRIDDFVIDTGILATIGHGLEKLHGTPFFFKLFIFTYYIGLLSSMFWVSKDVAKMERYHLKEPYERSYGIPDAREFRFMSSHGISMALVYFYLFKKPALRYLIIPTMLVDLYIWGPYFSQGILSGIAAGMIL
jgi:hypothetical protein